MCNRCKLHVRHDGLTGREDGLQLLFCAANEDLLNRNHSSNCLRVILIGFSSHSFELSQCSFILALMRHLALQLRVEPCATAVHQILFKFHLSFELCSGNGVADRFCFALNFFLRKRNLLLNALEIKTELCNLIFHKAILFRGYCHPPFEASGFLHLCLTNCFRYVEVGDWEEGVLFTCFFVMTAYRLAPSGETSEIVIEYSVAFTFPLLAGFQDGEIVQLFVIPQRCGSLAAHLLWLNCFEIGSFRCLNGII